MLQLAHWPAKECQANSCVVFSFTSVKWNLLGSQVRDSCFLCCVLSGFSHVKLCATLETVAQQAPLSMGFSRQGYWNGLPCLPLGYLPLPGIEPESPALGAGFFTTSTTWEALSYFL